jgi:hypothetical protein
MAAKCDVTSRDSRVFLHRGGRVVTQGWNPSFSGDVGAVTERAFSESVQN